MFWESCHADLLLYHVKLIDLESFHEPIIYSFGHQIKGISVVFRQFQKLLNPCSFFFDMTRIKSVPLCHSVQSKSALHRFWLRH